jgi:hypothetical protein
MVGQRLVEHRLQERAGLDSGAIHALTCRALAPRSSGLG